MIFDAGDTTPIGLPRFVIVKLSPISTASRISKKFILKSNQSLSRMIGLVDLFSSCRKFMKGQIVCFVDDQLSFRRTILPSIVFLNGESRPQGRGRLERFAP